MREKIFAEIEAERIRQDAKWGEQNHPIREEHELSVAYYKEQAEMQRRLCDIKANSNHLTWYDVIMEEIFEAFAEDTPERQRAELVQVVAVGVAMIERIDRNAPPQNVLCPECFTIWPPETKTCPNCGEPLTETTSCP